MVKVVERFSAEVEEALRRYNPGKKALETLEGLTPAEQLEVLEMAEAITIKRATLLQRTTEH